MHNECFNRFLGWWR